MLLLKVATIAAVASAALVFTQPLRNLGQSSDGETFLTEQDRQSHTHILGAPGEGKSKFLELLVRQDIAAGYGACLLDPSENGGTAYKVLNFCIQQGFDKVLLIDPQDVYTFKKIPTINPIHCTAPPNVSAGNIIDTIRVLWGNKFDDTPVIQRYLPPILRVLQASGMTLHEAVYFTDKAHPVYRSRSEKMLDAVHALSHDRVALEGAWKYGPTHFEQQLGSTSRRLNPFFDDVMKLIIGSKVSPVNFQKMISGGWLILVNLDPRPDTTTRNIRRSSYWGRRPARDPAMCDR